MRLPGEGESCQSTGCAEGLLCNFDDDLCQTPPTVGELCVGGFGCAEDLFCEAVDFDDLMSERRCFGPQKRGAACRGHSQCESSYCPAGFCELQPLEGEACAGVCASGLDCVESICQPADAAICWASMPYI